MLLQEHMTRESQEIVQKHRINTIEIFVRNIYCLKNERKAVGACAVQQHRFVRAATYQRIIIGLLFAIIIGLNQIK